MILSNAAVNFPLFSERSVGVSASVRTDVTDVTLCLIQASIQSNPKK